MQQPPTLPLDPQAFVPLAARVLLLPQAPADPLSVQLPLEMPGVAGGMAGATYSDGGAAGPPQLLTGLSLLLLHQRSTQLATLVSLTSWQRSTSSRRRRDARNIGKPLSPGVTAGWAFQLLPSGSQVGYSVIPLDDLLRGSHSGGAGRQQQARGQQEGALQRQEGVITTLLPGHTGGGSLAQGMPWIQLQQQGKGQRHAEYGSCDSAGAAFRYTLRVVPGSGMSADLQQQQQQHAGCATHKRKASGELGSAATSKRTQDAESGGGAAAVEQQGAQVPGPASAWQQGEPGERATRQPLVSFFFCSYDGTRSVRACARGWACPLESCRGLRCHSYGGLQQHLQATHAYHSYFFSEVMPDGGAEVYLRCKPGGWHTLVRGVAGRGV